ncbi:MAG TPA: hypothetical protein VMU95_06040 [Trebonia sp.]|nr:hypothetical protein [Trebonia sp.]
MSELFTRAAQGMPYRRWQRTALGSLPHAGHPGGVLGTAITAEGWREREGAIVAAAQ